MSGHPSASLAFRRARAADVAAIVALVESAYRGAASRRGWTSEADLLHGQRTDADAVAALIAAPASCILLGEQDGELLASLHLECRADTGHLGMFAVRPDRQGAGIGRAMLVAGEQRLQSTCRCRRLQMTVISLRRELIAWYTRRGYRPTDVFVPFPYGDERFGIPQRDDLRLQVLEKPLA